MRNRKIRILSSKLFDSACSSGEKFVIAPFIGTREFVAVETEILMQDANEEVGWAASMWEACFTPTIAASYVVVLVFDATAPVSAAVPVVSVIGIA